MENLEQIITGSQTTLRSNIPWQQVREGLLVAMGHLVRLLGDAQYRRQR